ncbi:hypothetical protein GYA54_00335 [Candidatus Kuenenbacteria bacterium]|nr:hypothetical protein [Candidatus Kuenenbacteria bacterium]
MSKTKIVATVAILVILTGAGYFLSQKDVVRPAVDKQTENIVGADKDDHGCIGSAGYQWCDASSKCYRAFEEFCPDKVEDLVSLLKQSSGVILENNGETEFNWIVGQDDMMTDAKVVGVIYEAEGIKMADYNNLENYLNNNWGMDKYNVADGVVGGLRGYYKDYMACIVNFRHQEMKRGVNEPSTPVGDSLKVTLECGYFNHNNIAGLLDAQAIKEILSRKYKKAIDEVRVSITRRDEAHLAGSIKFGAEEQAEGGLFLAVKIDDQWQVVYDGNGSVDCEKMKNEYGFTEGILRPNFCD